MSIPTFRMKIMNISLRIRFGSHCFTLFECSGTPSTGFHDPSVLSTLVNPVNQVTQSAGVACRASVQVPAALLIVAGSEALALLV